MRPCDCVDHCNAQGLYGSNAGSILFGPISGAESAACPAGAPDLRGTQAAAVVVAGAGSAARLERTMQGLLRRWGHTGEDVRGLFHIYVAVVGGRGWIASGAGEFWVDECLLAGALGQKRDVGQLLSA
jgi:hypothetical protein